MRLIPKFDIFFDAKLRFAFFASPRSAIFKSQIQIYVKKMGIIPAMVREMDENPRSKELIWGQIGVFRGTNENNGWQELIYLRWD